MMSESKALVTIIVATYNRPDALATCLRTVLLQTVKNWKLIVIGDNCDDRTEEVVLSTNDARIEYINLSDRFGEQSGPNSVGIALTDTKYLAFLNHDDVWLSNHLEYGINILENNDVDFFIGGAAYSRFIEYVDKDIVIHVDEINTSSRSPVKIFNHAVSQCEPASSWIIETTKAKEIGYWKYFAETHRAPISDYFLRAWRQNCKFYFSKDVTVWAVVTHYRNDVEQAYSYESKEHALIAHTLSSNTCEEVRELLKQKQLAWDTMPSSHKADILLAYSQVRPQKKRLERIKHLIKWPIRTLFYNVITAYFYKFTGKDIFGFIEELKGHKKGSDLLSVIKIRTGTAPLNKPNMEEIIKRVKKRPSLDKSL